jgi:putative dehydrogenase
MLTRNDPIGIIGLGAMGGVFAGHLVADGWKVVGFDVDQGRRTAAGGLGVAIASSAAEVAQQGSAILVVLPTAEALHAVAQEIAGAGVPQRTVVEMGTFALDDKHAVAKVLGDAGHVMVDCPVSGTGAQAKTKDLVLLASGDTAAIARLKPLFQSFAREIQDLGAFGNGIKMKFLANHLVSVHVAAAGEAMALARKAGMDPKRVLDVLTAGAADSKMLRLRGPMMVADRYDKDISARMAILMKDIGLIGDFGDDLECPLPVLGAAKSLYVAAMAAGRGDQDPAAVCAASEALAGLKR